MKFRICTTVCCLAASRLLLGPAPFARAGGEDSAKAEQAKSSFTLDEALQQLKLYPKDPYLPSTSHCQLARRAEPPGQGKYRRQCRRDPREMDNGPIAPAAAVTSICSASSPGRSPCRKACNWTRCGANAGRRGREVELAFRMNYASGDEKENIRQEIETLKRAREKRQMEIVEIASLTGPTINSHPWDEMLAGKKPDVGPLARKVPADFFFAEFGSLVKLLDVLDSGDLWSKHLLHQTAGEARSQQVGERLKRQLAVETNPLVRPFYDLVVEEVAVTGSDLFFNEGSDLTLLFQFKQPAVFKARMDGFLQSAEKADKTIQRSTGKSHCASTMCT